MPINRTQKAPPPKKGGAGRWSYCFVNHQKVGLLLYQTTMASNPQKRRTPAYFSREAGICTHRPSHRAPVSRGRVNATAMALIAAAVAHLSWVNLVVLRWLSLQLLAALGVLLLLFRVAITGGYCSKPGGFIEGRGLP
jgi:hypothetical protein